jgi:predicted amidohydrolase
MSALVVACVQANSGPAIADNLARIEPLVMEAHKKGARLIALPENVNLMIRKREELFATAKSEDEDPSIPFFCALAKKTGAYILAGSLAIAIGADKLVNRSYLFDPEGKIAARYDKIHLFDADLGDEIYRESTLYRAGRKAVTVHLPFGKLGFSICYDLRFPHLYRTLAKEGAEIIAVPAAFTATTGKMHWHVLLRARAIETGAFVIAPGQCGVHDGGRRTFGHSLIIDPLGAILAEAGDETCVITAECDLTKVAAVRRMLPSLQHDCEFERPC